MAERVKALHGTFHVRTKPGDGTEVEAWVSLPDVIGDD
jgi:signal transduction histidine kinase